MEDNDIITEFEQRNEDALSHTTEKYGKTIHKIAENILGNTHDADEIRNDALMKLWSTIPPQHPRSLFAYIAVIVRNIAYDKCRADKRKKRYGEQVQIALDEFLECIPSDFDVEGHTDSRQLSSEIQAFLGTLPQSSRIIFLQRYWAMMPVADIAEKYGINVNTVKTTLRRTREKLRIHLAKEGFYE